MKFQSSIVALTLALAALAATGSAARISMSSVASYWKRAGGSTSSCPTAVAVACWRIVQLARRIGKTGGADHLRNPEQPSLHMARVA